MTSPAASLEPSADQVLATLAGMLREVIDEPWVREAAIGMETSFGSDLELESIEFVLLAEKLQQAYGKRVDFAGWLAGMELDQIVRLSVGQVVEHIVACLRSSPTE
jgi:acyl carrier protein